MLSWYCTKTLIHCFSFFAETSHSLFSASIEILTSHTSAKAFVCLRCLSETTSKRKLPQSQNRERLSQMGFILHHSTSVTRAADASHKTHVPRLQHKQEPTHLYLQLYVPARPMSSTVFRKSPDFCVFLGYAARVCPENHRCAAESP